jgi:hypothetical protein
MYVGRRLIWAVLRSNVRLAAEVGRGVLSERILVHCERGRRRVCAPRPPNYENPQCGDQHIRYRLTVYFGMPCLGPLLMLLPRKVNLSTLHGRSASSPSHRTFRGKSCRQSPSSRPLRIPSAPSEPLTIQADRLRGSPFSIDHCGRGICGHDYASYGALSKKQRHEP